MFNKCGKQKPLNRVKLLLVQMGNVVNCESKSPS